MDTRRPIEEINGVRSRASQEDYGDPENNVGGSVAATVELPETVVTPPSSQNSDEVYDSPGDNDDEDLMEQAETVRSISPSAPRASDHPPSVEESPEIRAARADIEQTRVELASTIDEIRDRLSPAHLMQEAKEATVGRVENVVSHAVETVKETAGNVLEAAKEKACEAVAATKDAVHSVSEKIEEVRASHHTEATHPATPYGMYENKGNRSQIGGNEMLSTNLRELKNIGETLVETIKINPIPAAIAGFGLGWLLLSMRQQQNANAVAVRTDYAPTDYYRDNNATETYDLGDPAVSAASTLRAHASDMVHTVGDRASTVAHSIGDKASDIAHSVSDRASGIAHNVSDKASTVAQTVGDKASDLRERAGTMATGVRDKAGTVAANVKDRAGDLAEATKGQYRAASDGVERFVDEQPLAAGAIALLVGAAVGFLIPSTSIENRVVGPQRDRLMDQANDTFQNVSGKVQNVAQIALGQAKDSLSQTMDQAKTQIQQTVDQTRETVRNEAQNQGLTPTMATA